MVLTLASEGPAEVAVTTAKGSHKLSLPKGISVRPIAVQGDDRVALATESGSPVHLLAAQILQSENDSLSEEDHPQGLALYGHSERKGDAVTTSLTHLDIGMPVSLSLDVYLRQDDSHPGWFELPLYPDNRVKEVEFELDGVMEAHNLLVDGAVTSSPFSTRPITDGEYMVYISMTSQSEVAKRIPLYRYTLSGRHITDFDSWPVSLAWDATKMSAGQ
jgi:hypothetical protein